MNDVVVVTASVKKVNRNTYELRKIFDLTKISNSDNYYLNVCK